MTIIIDQGQHSPRATIARDVTYLLAPPVEWSSLGGAEHLVQFYDTDTFLLNALTAYVQSGLDAGDVCLVLATRAHRRELDRRLRAAGVDVAAARRDGTYRGLDARTTLAKLLADGWPEPQRFAQAVGGQVLRAMQHQRHVRIFGELVT